MNAEIVEAIRELGQTSCWEKASVIIGGIGTLLTFVVLWYNHRSIKLTQQTMRQAINLQLYEKRLTLYSRLSKDDAFVDAPQELKIVFSDEIYSLYLEIVGLCDEQTECFWEYCVLTHQDDKYNFGKRNVSEEDYRRIITDIDRTTDFLPTHREELKGCKRRMENVHQEICDKYARLEVKMKKIIEDSIS